jgi:integrase
MTFETQSHEWLERLRSRRTPVKPATLKTFTSIVRAHINPRIGNARLDSFDNGAMKAFADGLCIREPKLGPRTIRDVVLVAKMIVASAVDSNGNFLFPVKWNAHFIDLPKIGATTTQGIDAKGIQKLIQESPARYATLFAVAAGTGMRLGELLAIKIDPESWDYAGKMIHVKASIYRGTLQEPRTLASVRTVDVCAELNEAIAAFAVGRRNGFLFTGKTGKPIATRLVYAHLAGHGAHAFRRWRVSWLRKKNAPEDLVRFWTGHSNKSQTDAYSRMKEDVEYRREIAEKVGLGFALKNEVVAVARSVAK